MSSEILWKPCKHCPQQWPASDSAEAEFTHARAFERRSETGYNRSHKCPCTRPGKFGTQPQGGSHESGELIQTVYETGSGVGETRPNVYVPCSLGPASLPLVLGHS